MFSVRFWNCELFQKKLQISQGMIIITKINPWVWVVWKL